MNEKIEAGDSLNVDLKKGPTPGGLKVNDLEPIRSRDPYQVQVGGDHYQGLAIQPIKFIMANRIPFVEGCVIKRMVRHKNKNGIQDLEKAIHEIRLIAKEVYGVEL